MSYFPIVQGEASVNTFVTPEKLTDLLAADTQTHKSPIAEHENRG